MRKKLSQLSKTFLSPTAPRDIAVLKVITKSITLNERRANMNFNKEEIVKDYCKNKGIDNETLIVFEKFLMARIRKQLIENLNAQICVSEEVRDFNDQSDKKLPDVPSVFISYELDKLSALGYRVLTVYGNTDIAVISIQMMM